MLLTVIRKELLLILKDLHALVVLFLMPTAFILIMSLSLQDTFQKNEQERPRVGVLFVDQSGKEHPLVKLLLNLDGFQSKPYLNKSELLRHTKRDQLQAAIVVPAVFYNELDSEDFTPDSKRLQVHYAPSTPHAMSVLIESSIRKAIISVRIDTLLDQIGIEPAKHEIQRKKFSGNGLIATHELYSGQGESKPSSVQQSVPAWLIFSMFFVVIPITTTFLNEKQNGTLQRLRTLPVPTSYFLTGKLIPYLGINLIQTGLMFLIGIFLVPLLGGQALELNSQAWLLAPMSIAISITAITLALLIATLVKSTEQATTIGGLINLLLAALGGIMVPTFVMPEMMQYVAGFSPMNWGLEGFLTILLRGGNFVDILPVMFKLGILSVIFFTLAIYSYHRSTRVY